MQIYLLRHGIAEDPKAGSPDAARALTGDGRQKLRRVLDRAAAAAVRPSLILTSPYRRALETARMAGEILRCERIEECEALTPSHAPEDLWEAIRQHKREEAVLLTGHEPLFGLATGFLLGVPELRVYFKKAALVAIEQQGFGGDPHGTLKWMLTPALAKSTES
jgi:phosphohistidine phosphatase